MRAHFTLVCCVLPVWAYAIAAATLGQIVVAEVIAGGSGDCRPQHQDCAAHTGRLRIRIVEILALGDESHFRVFGEIIRDNKVIEPPHQVRTAPVVVDQTVEVSIRTPDEAPLRDDQVNERFLGRRLLLSLTFGGGVLPLREDQTSGPVGPSSSLPSGSSLYAEIWPTERREWIEKTIVDRNGEHCPKAVTNPR
jgi:hypothetical protein